MPNITYYDLINGDVLLEMTNKSMTHRIIQLGEAIVSHNRSGGHSSTVHAAIYTGSAAKGLCYQICEAVGTGLQCVSLQQCPINYKKVEYDVYRFNDRDLAQMAAFIAEGYVAERNKSLAAEGNYGAYSTGKATGSLFHSSARGKYAKIAESGLWGGGTHSNTPSSSFYCSSFVARCYAAAATGMGLDSPPINADFRWISPKELEAQLKKDTNWNQVGRLIA